MTYYIENRKSSEENEKRSFGRATLLKKNGKRRIVKLKNEKNADEKRYINERRRKLWELDKFLYAGGCENFHNFLCDEFHSINEPSR